MNHSVPSDLTRSDTPPAPGSEEKLDRLRALLREMFQLDRGDLDFGLYRIMNLKAGEITAFLDNDLLPQVQDTLQGISAEDRAKLEEELRSTLATIRELGGIDPEDTDKVKELRGQLADARADAEAEADVYGHLANFFARYYAEGDFMSQRRYPGGGGAYLSHPLRRRGGEAPLGQRRPVLRQDDGELRLLRLRGRGRRAARALRDRGRRQREGQRQGSRRQAAPLSPRRNDARGR